MSPERLKCSRSGHVAICVTVVLCQGAEFELRLIFSFYRLAVILLNGEGLWEEIAARVSFTAFLKEWQLCQKGRSKS